MKTTVQPRRLSLKKIASTSTRIGLHALRSVETAREWGSFVSCNNPAQGGTHARHNLSDWSIASEPCANPTAVANGPIGRFVIRHVATGHRQRRLTSPKTLVTAARTVQILPRTNRAIYPLKTARATARGALTTPVVYVAATTRPAPTVMVLSMDRREKTAAACVTATKVRACCAGVCNGPTCIRGLNSSCPWCYLHLFQESHMPLYTWDKEEKHVHII